MLAVSYDLTMLQMFTNGLIIHSNILLDVKDRLIGSSFYKEVYYVCPSPDLYEPTPLAGALEDNR